MKLNNFSVDLILWGSKSVYLPGPENWYMLPPCGYTCLKHLILIRGPWKAESYGNKLWIQASYFICMVYVFQVWTTADNTQGGAGQGGTKREGGSNAGDDQSQDPRKTSHTSGSWEGQTAGTHTRAYTPRTHTHTHGQKNSTSLLWTHADRHLATVCLFK